MPRSPTRLLISPLLVAGGCVFVGCEFVDAEQDWRDQLTPAGPCYEVDLLDGLDEDSTDELHAAFDCLNQSGNFESLAETVDAMDADARGGRPAGLELAALVNGLPELGLDLVGLAQSALDLLQSDAISGWLRASIELIYGAPWGELSDDEPPLSEGLVVPALPAAQAIAGVSLDDDLDAIELAHELVDGDGALSALHTLGAWSDAGLLDGLGADLGDAIERARAPENDIWSGASGDSLRDLTEAMIEGPVGETPLEQLTEPLAEILSDAETRNRIRLAVEDLSSGGALDGLPSALSWTVEVDTEGRTLGSAGADDLSALAALLRLLSDANEPLVCSINEWWFSYSFEIDNLAVALLSELATWDPDTVATGTSLFGELLGLPLTDDVLYGIADTQLCPIIDEQLVDDLHALDRFNDPEAGALLEVMLLVLDALYDPDGQNDHIPELAEFIDRAWVLGLAEPVQELLRDAGSGALVYGALDIIPALLEPDAELDTDDFPSGVRPLDLDGLLEAAGEALAGDGLQRLLPTLQAAAAPEETWLLAGNLARLLQEDGLEAADLELLSTLREEDPELETIRSAADTLLQPQLIEPTLMLLETPELLDAVSADPTGDGLTDAGAPLPFWARLVRGGTLDAALELLDTVLGWLQPEASR